MTELTTELAVEQTTSLIKSYAFDLGKYSIEKFLQKWLDRYHANWIRLATIEALYLGRYKAVSIEHILSVWLRLGSPNTHFTHEFERLICRKLPTYLIDITDFSPETINNSANSDRQSDSNRLRHRSLKDLSKEDAVSKVLSEKAVSSQKERERSKSPHTVAKEEDIFLNKTSPVTDTEKHPDKLASNSDRQKISPSESNSEPTEVTTVWEETSKPLTAGTDKTSVQTKSSPKTLVPAMKIPYQADWNGFAAEQTPIHQFVPMPDVSDFYNKLKAFGREKLEEQ